MADENRYWTWKSAVAFSALSAVIMAGALWIQANGYVAERTLLVCADILLTWQVPDFARTFVLVTYPDIVFYLSLLAYPLLPDAVTALPLFFAVASAAASLVLWHHLLRRAGWGVSAAVAVLLLTAHPFFLWAATRGTAEAFSLLAFTLIIRQLLALAETGLLRNILGLAGLLIVWFLVDPRFVYCLPALLPALLIVAPRELLAVAPGGYALLTLFPVTVTFGSFVYVNWMATGDWMRFLRAPDSIIHGAYLRAGAAPWLQAHGGEVATPLLIGLGMGLATMPILLILAVKAWTSDRRPVGALAVLAALPVVGLVLATLTRFAAHPADFLFLLLPVGVFCLCLAQRRLVRLGALAVLGLGVAMGWGLLPLWGDRELAGWSHALLGGPVDVAAPERRLAEFLRGGPDTMIDHVLGYPVIVALGDAGGLIVPEDNAFRVTAATREPVAPRIAVPSPDTERGKADRINQTFPDLYARGLPGYTLVYDRKPWRVWQRLSADRAGLRDQS